MIKDGETKKGRKVQIETNPELEEDWVENYLTHLENEDETKELGENRGGGMSSDVVAVRVKLDRLQGEEIATVNNCLQKLKSLTGRFDVWYEQGGKVNFTPKEMSVIKKDQKETHDEIKKLIKDIFNQTKPRVL